uniref:PD-(D/E)XK endonuclease-like domain-containing protein n=1 Tax=Chryseobacterium endophyticum TaxID=1854762 RepID=A0AAU6WRN7_9FLAO
MSQINTAKDIRKVLECYVLEGHITIEESKEIHRNLEEIIKDNTEFFDEKWEVINEKDIMITENGQSSVYRPDRLLRNQEGYIIVDFKTGDPSAKDENQIENYKNILEKLGRKVLKTQLIYL